MNANNYLKFACIYCGQHIECDPGFSGRQFHCPACKQRLVVPPTDHSRAAPGQTWDTQVPDASVETPTGYTTPGQQAG